MNYGGFWVRAIAYVVDSVIIVTLLFLMLAGLAFLGDSAALLMVAAVYVVPFAYFVLMQSSSRQATLGKQLLGLKVATADGERISILRSLARELAKIASAIPMGIGFLLAAFTGRKQGLHDMVASTTVTRDGGSVILGLLVALFGWVAPAAVITVVGMGILTAMMGTMGGGMLQEAMKDAQKQAAVTQPAPPRKPAASQPAQPPVAAKPVAAPATPAKDPQAVLASQLGGFEKPGTTRAGPAVLELATTFPSSFWIKVYVPPMEEFAGDSAVVVSLNRVLDTGGGELYDPKSSFETAFFQKVSLRPASAPAPHLGGTRQVSLRSGASTSALNTVEGTAKFRIPSKPMPVSFAAADVGKTQSAHGVAVTMKALKGKDLEISVAGDASRMVSTIGYAADGSRVRATSYSTSGGEMKLGFEQPLTRVEIVVAEQFVERSYPFTLSKTSMAGASIAAAPTAPPAAPPAAPVAKAPAPVATPKMVEAPTKPEVVAMPRRRDLPAPIRARTMDAPPGSAGSTAVAERPALKYNDLMTAVLQGDTGAVSELLSVGKWADKPDSRGVTPLSAAAYRGDAKTAEVLLRAGANPSPALTVARERRDQPMTELLEKYRK